MDRVNFTVVKSFGRLHLIPDIDSLRLWYVPNVNGKLAPESLGACDISIPLDAVGGLWATARAFLYGVESLDENIIIRKSEGDILIKLYRDKPKGTQGSLSGDELCWMRIVSGRTEEERRRIKLGPRDLLCVELACSSVLALSTSPLYQGTKSTLPSLD
ncbi:MAG: hypothetical protein LBE20_01685 [Deltaproteobacteria bacterium]|jgi:hypothetical protein|nr:hypothetical protein [Deltaproteobacteria bacterium]